MTERSRTGSRLDEPEIREETGSGPRRATIGEIRVEEVVAAWLAKPAIESVCDAFPTLTPEQVFVVLEDYQRHWAGISAGLGAEARERKRAEAMAERRAVEVGRGDSAVVAAVTITKRPGVCGGRACIDDTRIRVIDLVQLQREGRRPEEMQDAFAVSLTMAQVHLGLQYAARYPAEIEADFASHALAVEEGLRQRAEFFAELGIPDPSAEPGP